MPKLVLIRGLSGSGKSTMAKCFTDFIHLEADMFHLNDKGDYCFDANKVKEGHEWCQSKTKELLEKGYNVVVTNTFTRLWELDPYLRIAEQFCIFPNIIVCKNLFANTHNVPEEIMQKMMHRWEE